MYSCAIISRGVKELMGLIHGDSNFNNLAQEASKPHSRGRFLRIIGKGAREIAVASAGASGAVASSRGLGSFFARRNAVARAERDGTNTQDEIAAAQQRLAEQRRDTAMIPAASTDEHSLPVISTADVVPGVLGAGGAVALEHLGLSALERKRLKGQIEGLSELLSQSDVSISNVNAGIRSFLDSVGAAEPMDITGTSELNQLTVLMSSLVNYARGVHNAINPLAEKVGDAFTLVNELTEIFKAAGADQRTIDRAVEIVQELLGAPGVKEALGGQAVTAARGRPGTALMEAALDHAAAHDDLVDAERARSLIASVLDSKVDDVVGALQLRAANLIDSGNADGLLNKAFDELKQAQELVSPEALAEFKGSLKMILGSQDLRDELSPAFIEKITGSDQLEVWVNALWKTFIKDGNISDDDPVFLALQENFANGFSSKSARQALRGHILKLIKDKKFIKSWFDALKTKIKSGELGDLSVVVTALDKAMGSKDVVTKLETSLAQAIKKKKFGKAVVKGFVAVFASLPELVGSLATMQRQEPVAAEPEASEASAVVADDTQPVADADTVDVAAQTSASDDTEEHF